MPKKTHHHDWVDIRGKVLQALKSGEQPTYENIAGVVGIPRTTLQYGLKAFCEIPDADELIRLWHVYNGTSVIPESLPHLEKYQNIDPQLVLSALRERPRSISELSDLLDRGRTAVEKCLAQMLADNFDISREEDRISLPPYTPPAPLPTLYDEPRQQIAFGVFSDPHFGSKHIQASALLRFIRLAHEDYGITRFFVPGDLTAGNGVYRGQQNELYAFSADDQAESLCNTLPRWDDTQYLLMGGNHDYAYMKQNGLNIVKALSRMREDFVYLGFDQAEVPLLENAGRVTATAVLWHPSGGVPYALSYRGQKFAAELTRSEMAEVVMEEKPSPTVRFIFWGHLHVADWFPYGPIEVVGPGCFEGTNGYLAQKGLKPVVRGLIVQADVTDRGLIAATHIHPISFIEREDDYHAAYSPLSARHVKERIEPVFSYKQPEPDPDAQAEG